MAVRHQIVSMLRNITLHYAPLYSVLECNATQRNTALNHTIHDNLMTVIYGICAVLVFSIKYYFHQVSPVYHFFHLLILSNPASRDEICITDDFRLE